MVVLGRETENRKVDGKDVFTVPILFQCTDKQDVMLLDDVLRNAGMFPIFYWPDEILEFVGELKKEVRKGGRMEQDCWIRVRPEEEEGRIRIRVDTKPMAGGRFKVKGLWKCPPLKKGLWDSVEGILDPVWWERE